MGCPTKNNHMKDISIVLCPFENNAQFARVLEHVFTRTFYDFSKIELIVVDNNTEPSKKDEISALVRRYEGRCSIKHLQNDNVGQLAHATNRAIEVADSKWFVYLCATDTYIYDPGWLTYGTTNLSDEDYAAGYRIGGTITPWPNHLHPDLHYHVQGAVFIAFTEYMKANPYSPAYPFDGCDVMHSARCLEQGFKLKSIRGLLAHMDEATEFWHENNKRSKEFLIAHVHGLWRMP